MDLATPRRVLDPPLDIAENLARDEAILRAGEPTIRIGEVAAPGVSVGVGESDDGDSAARIRAAGLPVVRRMSGGSALLHLPGDVVWSVVVPRSSASEFPDVQGAYAMWGEAAVRALAEWKISSAWVPAPGQYDEYCLLSARGQVLEVEGRVLGGAAQHLTRDALLHHGVVGWNVDRTALLRLFGVPEGLSRERLCGLAEIGLVDDSSRQAFARQLLRGLAAVYGRHQSTARADR